METSTCQPWKREWKVDGNQQVSSVNQTLMTFHYTDWFIIPILLGSIIPYVT